MSINCEANPCPVLVNASCVFYEGPNLICLGVNTNETLESALGKINSLFCQVLSQQGSSGTSGTSGSSGTNGTSGTDGSNGTSGSNGRNGSSGTSGSAGSTGSSGSAGSSGTSGEKGDTYRTFSTTCFTLGDAGTIFVEPGLAYTPAQAIVIANSALIYQISTVISYNNITGELVFSLPTTVVGAIDEYCTWDVNLNGASGGDGSDGTSGTNGSAGTSGSQGSDGSNGTSGISCLSAVIINAQPIPLNIIYFQCDGTYQNYDIVPSGDSGNICYQSGTLQINGSHIFYPQGICNGTSGTSGLTCTSLEVTNVTLDPKTYDYINCAGDLVEIEIQAEQFISICATSWNTDSPFNIVNKGVCSGTSGTSGSNGTGGGGSSCPDHFKLAAVSGIFNNASTPNSPGIVNMYGGHPELGWSFGAYDVAVPCDGFGNLNRLSLRNANCGIPLSVDLNVGDTIKISGIAYLNGALPVGLDNPKFYITVSRFNCSDITEGAPLYTVIPVAAYPLSGPQFKVCFSELISLASILPSDETFFVVGMNVGSDSESSLSMHFSYTLDVTQACIGTGKNILIRNCCDPAYTNVIIDNLVPIGQSFSDTDKNCWTVEAQTLSAVTAVRTLGGTYNNCNQCIFNNPCPENFKIRSCCSDGIEVFSAALIGVNVGDTFVDTNGYCWSALGTTPVPITNVVEVGTVYPITTCDDAVCTDLNFCPHSVLLESCCGLFGYSTLELLQAAIPTLVGGDVFVDTFGMCWRIQDARYAFPNLAFIIPSAETPKENGCEGCVADNPCARDFYYTIQNCCSEEVEVVVLKAIYNVGDSLLLELDIAFGCYKVLSWSDVGTVTATVNNIIGNSGSCDACLQLMKQTFDQVYCQGQFQCCTSFINISELSIGITGYKCDGTWLSNYIMVPNETICMAIIIKGVEFLEKQGCCGFDIRNPSPTAELQVQDYDICYNGAAPALPVILIPPLGSFTDAFFAQTDIEACLSCVYVVSSPYEYLPCPF